MTSKQRTLATLSHREPDRVPVDFGATMETGIHLKAYAELCRHLGLNGGPVRERLKLAQLAHVDSAVQQKIGADVRGLYPGKPDGWAFMPATGNGYETYVDEFGIGWRRAVGGGLYYDMASHPLAGAATPDDIDAHPFPDPRDAGRFRHVQAGLDAFAAEGDFPVVFDNSFGNGIFQMGNHVMGYEHFLVALGMGEAKAVRLMDKVLELKIAFWDEVLGRFGGRIDVVKELDDLGTQFDTMISPEMYAALIKPRLAELVRFIKSKAPHVKMMMHACGSMAKMIPHLIEAGVEILNPLQYTAAGMDPAALKREFGRDLVFWGGGIETQKMLPFGTVAEVQDEVKRLLDILMPGGGFVFAQVHNIQAGVPVANMMAMWEAVREYGRY
ncbi:MAG: hypothetical protein JXR37_10740 [Kiritimatiellae bacterium]|nr:hypothetical protein [Kiritimatiellia bacterium]